MRRSTSLMVTFILSSLVAGSAAAGPPETRHRRAFAYVEIVDGPLGPQQLRRAVLVTGLRPGVELGQDVAVGPVLRTVPGPNVTFPTYFEQLAASPDNRYFAAHSVVRDRDFADYTGTVFDMATGGSILSFGEYVAEAMHRASCRSPFFERFLADEARGGATPEMLASYDYRNTSTVMKRVHGFILGWTGVDTILVSYSVPITAFGPRLLRELGNETFQIEMRVAPGGDRTPLSCNAGRSVLPIPYRSISFGTEGQVLYRKAPVYNVDRHPTSSQKSPLKAIFVAGYPR
jgi:hypothetical protein